MDSIGVKTKHVGQQRPQPHRPGMKVAPVIVLLGAATVALFTGIHLLGIGQEKAAGPATLVPFAAAGNFDADERGTVAPRPAPATASMDQPRPAMEEDNGAPLVIEPAVIVAQLEGNGSDYELPGEFVRGRENPGRAGLEALVLGPNVEAGDKLAALGALVEEFASKEEAIALLTRVAADPGQPEEVRADAVAKLADHGTEYTAWMLGSDSAAVAAEADLVARLEAFRLQQGLPKGDMRADLRR